MKNESTNRRKKLPLLLGALLIISVAAYGTRAYFSDSATQQADIKLELGSIDIAPVETDIKWRYTPQGVNSALFGENIKNIEIKNGMSITSEIAKNITNVQPGDQFTRIFEFENIGTLAQNVTFKNNVESAGIFKVGFEQVDADGIALPEQTNSTTIKHGESVLYKMTISVDTNNDYDATHNNKNDTTVSADKLIFNALADNTSAETLLKNAVTVTAKQTNDESK